MRREKGGEERSGAGFGFGGYGTKYLLFFFFLIQQKL